MLPPGHIAAGFLTAYGTLHLLNTALTPGESNVILAAGAMFGAIPDGYRLRSIF